MFKEEEEEEDDDEEECEPDLIEKLSLNNKENTINFLTLHNLLNLSKIRCFKSLESTQLVPQSHFTDIYLNTCNENIIFMIVILRDKCYQLFTKARKYFAPSFAHAIKARSIVDYVPLGLDNSREVAWSFMLNYMDQYSRVFAQFVKSLPGFGRICDHDLFTVIKSRIFSCMQISTDHLVIDGEYYLLLNDQCQMSRALLVKVLNEEIAHEIFDFHTCLKALELSEHEMGVIVPLILSSPGYFFF